VRGHFSASENDLSTGVADALSGENIALGRSQHRA
jgi:hypothetical protein